MDPDEHIASHQLMTKVVPQKTTCKQETARFHLLIPRVVCRSWTCCRFMLEDVVESGYPKLITRVIVTNVEVADQSSNRFGIVLR